MSFPESVDAATFVLTKDVSEKDKEKSSSRLALMYICDIYNGMKKETKEAIQIYTAVGMLVAGVGLSIAGFIVAPMGQIHDSVLWFFAQCLIYAGSIFGIGIYVNGKFNYLVDKLNQFKECKL